MSQRRKRESVEASARTRIIPFNLSLSLATLLILFLLFPLSPVPLRSAAASSSYLIVSTATREGRLAVFDDVWETVRKRYYDPAFHGLDWQAEREKYRPVAADASTTAEFYAVLRRMLGALRDAHTRVFAPAEKFDWRHPRFIGVGVSVREIDSAPVVVAVEKNSEAERAGVSAGDVILSVDGENALGLFARRLREQGGSSTIAAARARAMSKLFDGASDSTVSVVWSSVGGTRRAALLKREWRSPPHVFSARRVRGQIGVIEFNIFTPEVATSFMRALEDKLRDARGGLVIDLRNNGGGETEALIDIASAFLPAGKSLGRFTKRGGQIEFEPHTRSVQLFSPERIRSFQAPIIILTSERTSSAAEIFAAALGEARRARILGQNTCGCALGLRTRHTLPDGGELHVSELDYRTATGARIEGAGIAPDEKFTPNLKDLRARRDRAMERAIELLLFERQAR